MADNQNKLNFSIVILDSPLLPSVFIHSPVHTSHPGEVSDLGQSSAHVHSLKPALFPHVPTVVTTGQWIQPYCQVSQHMDY